MSDELTFNRRNFLAGMTALAIGFRDQTLQGLEKLKPEEGAPDNEEFWLRVRNEFQIDKDLIALNNVGVSPSPKRIIELQAKLQREANLDPSYIMWRKQDKELEAVRESLAKLVGCKPTELALTANASFGLQTTISGFQMDPGDEILTTNHDYPRTITAIQQRERRERIKMVQIELPPRPIEPHEWANLIESHITPRTRLVCLCRINYLNGQIVPLPEIKKILQPKNIILMADCAQSIGLLPDTFQALGDNIYLASLHKWMMGPIPTGVFAVREDLIHRIWPLHPADADLDDNITKFEQIGTHSSAPMLAMKEGIEFHRWIGLERKSARVAHLRGLVAKGLTEAQGVLHYSHLGENMGHGMYAVGFEKVPSAQLAGWLLQKHNIHVTTSTRNGFDGIRISPSIFSATRDIELLTSILVKVSRDGLPS